MAAKIGILGESTVYATGEITVYTVPADKAARVRILFAADHSVGTSGRYEVKIGTPNGEILWQVTRTVDEEDVWTGIRDATNRMLTTDIGLNHHLKDEIELVISAGFMHSAITPMPIDFFLSTGDTVKFNNANQVFGDHLFQVIGVEDDA